MPTYDYHCAKCDHKFELFQSINDRAIRKCPSCGAKAVKRLIGAGAGLIFRGSGFYCTDYRKGSAPAPTDSESSASKAEQKSSGESKGEQKPSGESKAEPKPSGAPKAEPKSSGSQRDGKKED